MSDKKNNWDKTFIIALFIFINIIVIFGVNGIAKIVVENHWEAKLSNKIDQLEKEYIKEENKLNQIINPGDQR